MTAFTPTFADGSVVYLQSGGQPMTVVHSELAQPPKDSDKPPMEIVMCVWHSTHGQPLAVHYHAFALTQRQ